MAPVMRLTLRWEEGDDEKLHTTLKIKLPRAWKEGPTSNLKNLFIESYNKKHPENQLDPATVHLLNPKGEQLADDDVVIRVLNPSDTVRVKPGAPPSLEQVEDARKNSKKGMGAKTVIDEQADDNDGQPGHVTSAEALKEANEPKFAFDYSKWDRLDLSDDDGDDCHPNIDLASWKRLRGRQRNERREQEDKKIQKYNAKIDKYKKKAEQLREKIKSDDTNAQLQVDLKEAENSQKEYESKLQHFLDTRKLVADDVCEVKESKGMLAEESPSTAIPSKAIYPETKQKEYDSYDAFQKDNRKYLKQFAVMKNDIESQEFLLTHPSLLCDHAEGFLLILTLDTCMKHQLTDRDPTIQKTEEQILQERAKEYMVAKQHLTIHYICELGKSMNRNPLDGVKPFYRKTGPKAEDRVEGFEEDLRNFLKRIRNRATEKIEKGEITPLVEAESSLVESQEVLYEPAGVGPGGLDPNEVLQSLPEELQEAFIEQDTDKLRAAFESLPAEEAEYHLQRCIDSGLWVPAAGDDDEGEEEMQVDGGDGEGDEEEPQDGEMSKVDANAAEAAAASAPEGPTVGDVE